MATQQIIQLVFYGISVIAPSLIALITLLNKKAFNKNLKSLQLQVKEGFNSNQLQHNQIALTLTQHRQSISKFLQQKNIANRLRQISKHAIQYCGNRQLGKILDTFTQQFIAFVQDITDIGFQNTTKQQILAKLSVARQNTNRFASDIFGHEYTIQWHNNTQETVHAYLRQVFQIYSDVINNKNARFLIKSEDLAQTIVRDFILFCAKLNYDLLQYTHKRIQDKL